MKQLAALVFVFAFGISGFSQDELADNELDASYLDAFLKECKKRHAEYIRQVEPNGLGRFEATTVSIYGDTVFIGEYSDPDCTTPHGRFAYFHENGKVQSMGYYSSARKVGVWKHYKDDGTPKPFVKYATAVPEELKAKAPVKQEIVDEEQLADPAALAAAEAAMNTAKNAEQQARSVDLDHERNASAVPPKSNKRLVQDLGLPMVW